MTAAREPLARADDLPAISGQTWLYTGAEGPPLGVHGEAHERYLANRALADQGRLAHAEVEARVRQRLATMLRLDFGDIALVGNASEAMNLVAASLQLQSGDNVILNDLEYPSVILPWLRLRDAGIEVRFARHVDWKLPAATFAELIDERTRVIAVSHVSYLSGWSHDLRALSATAATVGALVAVDATQSLGVVPVPAHLVDVVISSSYKFLLAGHGLGILAWNRRKNPLLEPPAVGWRSVPDVFTQDRFERYVLHEDARRFEVGFPSYPTIYALDASLEWLARFAPKTVEQHVHALGGRLIGELRDRGWPLLTPDQAERRAGNVAMATEHGTEIAEVLARRNVHCWGGDGRLRASLHLFNGDRDVDRLLEELDHLPRRLRP